jgi:hypothetical protein
VLGTFINFGDLVGFYSDGVKVDGFVQYGL